MNNFIMFVAPFVVLILAVAAVFWVAPKDKAISEENEQDK